MKKNIAYLVVLIALLVGVFLLTKSFVNNKEVENKDKVKVVATIYPQYDFVKHIAGDKVELKMLLKPGAEHHSYEPTPQDIKDIKNSDIFIYAGGESDLWVEKILKSLDGEDKKPKSVALVDMVDTVNEEIVEGMEDDHDHEHEHEDDHDEDGDDHDHDKDKKEDDHDHEHEHEHEGELDEHVWTSPKNAATIVERISNILEVMDPKNADTYDKNADSYIAKLNELDKEFKDVISKAKNKTLVFGDRFPFRYFVDRYGLKYYAAFPGCSADTEASASTVAFLIDKIKELKLKTVLKIELSKGDMADSISESTGAKVMTLHSAHNISGDDFANGVTYVDIMKDNVKVIEEALK